MAHTNLSFEIAGASPGLASSWTLTTSAGTTVAGFVESGEEVGWESFETWVSGYRFELAVSLTIADISASIFVVPLQAESFEVGWAPSQAFLTELGATTAAVFDLNPFESFETGWGVSSFETSLAGATTAAPTQDFETGWLATPYATTLAVSTTTLLDAGGLPVANFENVFAPVEFTVSAAPNVMSAVAHGMLTGRRVSVRSTGRLPDGLSDSNWYYIVGAAANAFGLSGTPGGAAITVSSPGYGSHFVDCDGVLEWTLTDV